MENLQLIPLLRDRKFEEAEVLLREHPECAHETDKDGRTPLFFPNSLPILRILLESVDLNAKTKSEDTVTGSSVRGAIINETKVLLLFGGIKTHSDMWNLREFYSQHAEKYDRDEGKFIDHNVRYYKREHNVWSDTQIPRKVFSILKEEYSKRNQYLFKTVENYEKMWSMMMNWPLDKPIEETPKVLRLREAFLGRVSTEGWSKEDFVVCDTDFSDIIPSPLCE